MCLDIFVKISKAFETISFKFEWMNNKYNIFINFVDLKIEASFAVVNDKFLIIWINDIKFSYNSYSVISSYFTPILQFSVFSFINISSFAKSISFKSLFLLLNDGKDTVWFVSSIKLKFPLFDNVLLWWCNDISFPLLFNELLFWIFVECKLW